GPLCQFGRPGALSFRPALNVDGDASARLGAPNGAENHGETADVVVADRLRLDAFANRRHEVMEHAEMPANAIVGSERRRLDRLDRVEEAVALAGSESFDADR